MNHLSSFCGYTFIHKEEAPSYPQIYIIFRMLALPCRCISCYPAGSAGRLRETVHDSLPKSPRTLACQQNNILLTAASYNATSLALIASLSFTSLTGIAPFFIRGYTFSQFCFLFFQCGIARLSQDGLWIRKKLLQKAVRVIFLGHLRSLDLTWCSISYKNRWVNIQKYSIVTGIKPLAFEMN